MDAEKYALPPLSGRFVSDDLPVKYDLELSNQDLKAVIRGPSGDVRSTAIFKRVDERTFFSGILVLKFDPDQRGFTVTNGSNMMRVRRSPG